MRQSRERENEMNLVLQQGDLPHFRVHISIIGACSLRKTFQLLFLYSLTRIKDPVFHLLLAVEWYMMQVP